MTRAMLGLPSGRRHCGKAVDLAQHAPGGENRTVRPRHRPLHLCDLDGKVAGFDEDILVPLRDVPGRTHKYLLAKRLDDSRDRHVITAQGGKLRLDPQRLVAATVDFSPLHPRQSPERRHYRGMNRSLNALRGRTVGNMHGVIRDLIYGVPHDFRVGAGRRRKVRACTVDRAIDRLKVLAGRIPG